MLDRLIALAAPTPYALSGSEGASAMRSVTTLTAAFAHFGAVPKNVQYAWSAVSETGEFLAEEV
jgi:hypothetical protein